MDPNMMALGSGGAIMNNLFSLFGSGASAMFNRSQVQQMEDYQTQMSNTAYQRSVQDMKAAGINPILAASRGGASTPSGGAATMSAPQMTDMVAPGVSTAMAKQRLDQDMKTAEWTNAQQREDTWNKIRQGKNIEADTANKLQNARLKAPDEVKARLDAATMNSSAMATIRNASTVAEEIARGVGATKDAVSPLVSSARAAGRGW